MFTDQSTDISLGASCRALDAVRADKEHNYWIAGTTTTTNNTSSQLLQQPSSSSSSGGGRTNSSSSSTSSSTLQILQFHNDINEIVITASYDIDGPGVRKVSSCPYDKELVLVASEQRSSATLYRLPPYGDNLNDNDTYTTGSNRPTTDSVEVVATLTPEGGFGANIADIAWGYDTSSSSSDHTMMDGTNNSGASINTSTAGDVLTIDANGHLTLWDMNTHQQVLSLDTVTTVDNPDVIHNKSIPQPKVIWDPHTNGHTFAVTVPTPNKKHMNMVSIFDVRCTKENMSHNHTTSTITAPSFSSVMDIGGGTDPLSPPHYGIMDIDYNHNRPYMMGMACRDGTCKFYDLRYCTTTPNTKTKVTPVVCVARGGHTHYCTSIRYNPFHDQLVVSTGTDHISNLWRLSSCSSAPILLPSSTSFPLQHSANPMNDMDDDNDDDYMTSNNISSIATTSNDMTSSSSSTTTAATNVCVQRYEYSDAVYTTAWGANDAWIYLTISYQDGKAVLQHVPSTEKYKILL